MEEIGLGFGESGRVRTSDSRGISSLLRAAARHFSGISLYESVRIEDLGTQYRPTSSTVVMPHSLFMQKPFSCQNGHSR